MAITARHRRMAGAGLLRRQTVRVPANNNQPLLDLVNGGTYTNASASSRYLWDPINEVLYGPFATNVRATCAIAGKQYIQIEGSRTNEMDDWDAFTTSGSVAITGGQTDPLGGSTAFLIENAGGGDDCFLTLSGAVGVSATVTPSMFIKAVSTTNTLNWDNQGTGPGRYEIDMSALSTTAWTRLHSDHAAINVDTAWNANASGDTGFFMGHPTNRFDFYAWFPQLEEATYPSSPIPPSSTPITRSADSLSFASLPADMLSGLWSVGVVPYYADPSVSGTLRHHVFWSSGIDRLFLDNIPRARILAGGGSTVNACSWSRYSNMTLTVDTLASELTVAGADSGNDTESGTHGSLTDSTWFVGSVSGTSTHLDGLISEPEAA